MTLLARGHLSDPIQVVVYRSLVMLQSMLCAWPECHPSFISVVAAYVNNHKIVTGVIGVATVHLKFLHWEWFSPFVFRTPCNKYINITHRTLYVQPILFVLCMQKRMNELFVPLITQKHDRIW